MFPLWGAPLLATPVLLSPLPPDPSLRPFGLRRSQTISVGHFWPLIDADLLMVSSRLLSLSLSLSRARTRPRVERGRSPCSVRASVALGLGREI